MDVPAAGAVERLIGIIRRTLADLQAREGELRPITLDSTLDHDLGLDSLARVELFSRIEQELGVHLPDSLFGTAETVRDIAAAISGCPVAAQASTESPTEPKAAKARVSAPAADLSTLDQLLEWHAAQHSRFPQITLCGEGPDQILSYGDLLQEARVIAGGLQRQSIRLGDTVALMLPTSREYFCAFFGVLLAGAVPVPLYPPARLSQIEEHVRRHTDILANAGAAILITTTEMRRLAGLLRSRAPSLRRITTCEELRRPGATLVPVTLQPDSTALLQYTSGSTGQPKGVVLSHANLLANIRALGAALKVTDEDVFVSWLPLYHDMGLIGAWLGTHYFGLPLIIMSPLSFLTRPVRWLEALHRYRGTLSAAPNFAYELCLKRITDAEIAGLDLSAWRLAMNGAEAVMPDTLLKFGERFAACGFRATALTPVYGLAESSVGLTIPPLERVPLIDSIERDAFTKERIAKPAAPTTPNPLRFVSCGRTIAGHEVRIVDEMGGEVAERREGRLEFRGPSATRGYFRNPEATNELVRDGWLDSGDRAYIAQGEVYLTGRIKDIIIRAGRHLYPDELEAAVGMIPDVRKGCVAVFGSVDAASGTERVVVLAETRIEESARRELLRSAISERVMAIIGEPPDEIVLVPPHTVLKTSSGKLRRAASRELYESGNYASQRQRSARAQLIRLFLGSAVPGARRLGRRVAALAYGVYFWTCCLSFGGLAALLSYLPLSHPRQWATVHVIARALVRAIGVPFAVDGREQLYLNEARVVAVNHASYLDGVFLAALLPQPCRFVAKRELERMPLVGPFLRRIGTIFVERFDARASVADARRVAGLASRDQATCIFFPEGTFTRAPGLMPFHLGAFATAVEIGSPILPVALHGTRELLRDEQWLPRRAPVVAHIGAAISPAVAPDAFAAAVESRDRVREFIARHCGEPDLSGSALEPPWRAARGAASRP